MVERTAAAAERVSTQSATAFGALRNRVRVPNILIPGPSVHDNQYYSNLRIVFETSFGEINKIRHFACERDFYVLRNHMYKTYFDPHNFPQKARSQVNKT